MLVLVLIVFIFSMSVECYSSYHLGGNTFLVAKQYSHTYYVELLWPLAQYGRLPFMA